MSERNLICEERPLKCELCGNVEETRPYGPNGERICFSCGMRDEETTMRRLRQHVFGLVPGAAKP